MARTVILDEVAGGSMAAKEKRAWAASFTRGLGWPDGRRGSRSSGTLIGRARLDRVGVVDVAGDGDRAVQVHRVQDEGAAVGGAERERGVRRALHRPLVDVAGRHLEVVVGAVARGLVQAGGQRARRHRLGGGAGRGRRRPRPPAAGRWRRAAPAGPSRSAVPAGCSRSCPWPGAARSCPRGTGRRWPAAMARRRLTARRPSAPGRRPAPGPRRPRWSRPAAGLAPLTASARVTSARKKRG